MRRAALALSIPLLSSWPATLAAQPPAVSVGGAAPDPSRPVVVVADLDDDDEDGVADALEEADVPTTGLLELSVRGPAELTAIGPVRLLAGSSPVSGALALPASARPHVVHVQGVRVSRGGEEAAVVVRAGGATSRIPLAVVGLAFLDGANRPIDPTTRAVGLSHEITNAASLPRRAAWDGRSGDPDDLRIELTDGRVEGNEVRVTVEVAGPDGLARSSRPVVLRRRRAGQSFRSDFLRLVGDEMDQQAPGVGEHVLRVALRDFVRVRHPERGAAASQSVRVGRPGREDGPAAARRGRLRVRVLRASPGGMPVVGGTEPTALAIGRRQVAIANEIWLQCYASFGDPDAADVRVVDPPPPALVSVADRDGLPARGGGVIRLRVGGRPIAPVTTRPGAPPVQTALDLAAAIGAVGFGARVTENPRNENGAGRSADVVVRDASGAPVAVTADDGAPLGTDAQQSVRIGAVDLSDGLQEFDNMTASAGTLEERTLVKLLGDDDPSTVDVFVINHFTGGTRQGEAFIEADGGAIVNTVILDRNGVRQEREAWTQSHELGHVLLNQPYHPDNVGPDRPWLLMDADSSLGLVTGPKRLSWDECHRARVESGADAVPALLDRLP